MGRRKDLTNRRFGKLVAIRPTNKRSSSGCVIWECKCDCGNFHYVPTEELTRGNIKSCGCYQYKWNKKDLTGKRYGKLLVLKDSGKRKIEKIVWECKCDCGNITYITTGDLCSGHTKSCGCIKTSCGEDLIKNLLTKYNIDFKREWTGFTQNKCMNKENTYPLFFDFYLPNYNICIEYDGKQHFKPNDFFGGKESFIKTQEHDKIKTQYCKNNNIKLIRIPYTDINKININYLQRRINELNKH